MTKQEILAERTRLIAIRDVLKTNLDVINSDLDRARRECAATGNYYDTDWYTRAEGAARKKGREILKINTRLGELRRLEKEINVKENEQFKFTMDRQIIAICRRKLGKEAFEEVVREAAHVSRELEEVENG